MGDYARAYLPRLKKRSFWSSLAVSRFDLMAPTLASAAFTAGRSSIALNQRARFGIVLPLHALDVVIACPREGGDVGDRVFVAAEIGRMRESLFQHFVEPLHLGLIARHRIGMIRVLRREHLEMGELAEHRPDARGLQRTAIAARRISSPGRSAGICRSSRPDTSGSRRTRTPYRACRPGRRDRRSPESSSSD